MIKMTNIYIPTYFYVNGDDFNSFVLGSFLSEKEAIDGLIDGLINHKRITLNHFDPYNKHILNFFDDRKPKNEKELSTLLKEFINGNKECCCKLINEVVGDEFVNITWKYKITQVQMT
jgi:hypothetical protein